MTVEQLRGFGADVDDALRRCMNNEAFYLNLVERTARDPSFGQLKEAVEAGDLDRGFELAHALKGVLANLSLTPILTPVQDITELLRSRTDTDYSPLIAEMLAKQQELAGLL